MEAITWCQQTFENERTQKKLEDAVQSLLQSVLKDKDEYQQEKAIKSFSEGLGYLESLLLYKNGIHRNQISVVEISKNQEEYIRKYKEVEAIMESEIKRQKRHFLTFL